MQKAGKGVAVITGASAGVGRASVRTFAGNGYDIGLIARNLEGLDAAKQEVESKGRRASFYVADVADPEAVEAAAAQFEKELGPIEVWVNNAMNSVFSPVKEMKVVEYARVTNVTYLGQVYGTLSALKRMLPRNKGSIVFVGSALSYRGIPLQSAYCGSKHAIQGFFDSLRAELMHDKSKVQITMVQLPALNTTQFGVVKSRLQNKPKPMGTIYQPEVAADAILYAAENDRREVIVGFSTLLTIVGNKIAPWYVDHVLARNGYNGQQTEEPDNPHRMHNLWQTIPGDHGAHGNFGDKARDFSMALWLTKHRATGILLAVVIVAFMTTILVLIF
ncbi:MAG: SDR family oxidoreductase [Bacteroidia bacterium]